MLEGYTGLWCTCVYMYIYKSCQVYSFAFCTLVRKWQSKIGQCWYALFHLLVFRNLTLCHCGCSVLTGRLLWPHIVSEMVFLSEVFCSSRGGDSWGACCGPHAPKWGARRCTVRHSHVTQIRRAFLDVTSTEYNDLLNNSSSCSHINS